MSSALRKEQHLVGRKLMQEEKYLEAIEVFSKAFSDYGSHVLLLGDLISCNILLGRQDTKFYIQRYEQELKKAEKHLKPTSTAKAYIFLGKLFEEHGDLAQSLESYQKAETFVQENQQLLLMAKCQSLRFLATYLNSEPIESYYQQCLQNRKASSDVFFEVEHALLLAEVQLMGPTPAFERLKDLMNHPEVLEADQRLLYFDFMESVLQKGLSLQSDWIQLSTRFESLHLDPYEKTLSQMIEHSTYRVNFSEMNALATEVSPLALIRLHRLSVARAASAEEKKALESRMLTLLKAISKKSYLLLSKKWGASEGTLTLEPSKEKIFWDDKELAVKNDSLQMRILSVLASTPTISTEEFIKIVFEVEFDEHSYDRARKAVSRCNQMLMLLTGYERSLLIRKNEVALHPGIQILRR